MLKSCYLQKNTPTKIAIARKIGNQSTVTSPIGGIVGGGGLGVVWDISNM